MNVRNRMADVVKLRCNVCQDFLCLVIQPNWQEKLYDIAKDAVENHKHEDNYIAVYEKMRDIGIKSYTVEDMDVTLIIQVLRFCKDIAKVNKKTMEALIKIKEDRNLTNHSPENEDEDELYLRGLLALCNLRNFVRTVDKFETNIDDELRLTYRKKYIAQINELKTLMDDERIDLVQKNKEIDRYIKIILESNDPKRTFSDISSLYMDRAYKVAHNPYIHEEFMIKASDAGIVEAHSAVVDYMIIENDYVEGERRMKILLNSYERLPNYDAIHIINQINMYLMKGNKITDGMLEIIDKIIEQGYNVEKTSYGYYKVHS